MAVLLDETFADGPDGPPPPAWDLTGSDALVVEGGALTLAAGDLNGYAEAELSRTPQIIEAVFRFDAGTYPTVCIISHGEPVFVGADMGLHVVIRPDTMAYQVRVDNGDFPALPIIGYTGGFAGPGLPRDTPLLLRLVPDGDTCAIRITDDEDTVYVDGVVSDPRVGLYRGPKLVLQVIRAEAEYGRGAWLSVKADSIPVGWRLVPPSVTERFPIKGSLAVSMTTEGTVFGDDAELHTSMDGVLSGGGDDDGAIPFDAKYIWHGGHDNVTADPAIRNLWTANGFAVEEVG